MLTSTIQILALALCAQAVTISLWGDQQCENIKLYTCANIAQGTCCVNPSSGGTFAAALFNGLPLPAAQGIVYPTNRAGAMGCTDTNSCNAGSGENVCLKCSTSLVGANWIMAVTSKREAEPECSPVNPNIVHFLDGRSFDIFYDVPEEDTNALIRLREEDPGLEGGVPENLLRYERG